MCDVALLNDVHVTNFATGCIYKYDDEHQIGGKPFTEDDDPNFGGSFYSETKSYMEMMLRHYPNVMQCRVRMPIDGDLAEPAQLHHEDRELRQGREHPELHDGVGGVRPHGDRGRDPRANGRVQLDQPRARSRTTRSSSCTATTCHPGFTWENFTEEEQAAVIKSRRGATTRCAT